MPADLPSQSLRRAVPPHFLMLISLPTFCTLFCTLSTPRVISTARSLWVRLSIVTPIVPHIRDFFCTLALVVRTLRRLPWRSPGCSPRTLSHCGSLQADLQNPWGGLAKQAAECEVGCDGLRFARSRPAALQPVHPSLTSSVRTLKLFRVLGPKVLLMATSAASRPRAINTRPMRGVLLRASKMYQWPSR